MKYLALLQGQEHVEAPSTPPKGLGEALSKPSEPVLKVLKVTPLGVSGPKAPPVVGPRVVDALRRGREAALKEGLDVTATEPGWSRNSKLVPDSRTIRIPAAVRVKIEAIEAEARAKGWPVELLYNADFWRLPRGLAAVLDEDDEIGEVTADYIEILKCQRNLLRFQRSQS